MTIDWTKPLERSNGQPVRLLGILDGDRKDKYVIATRLDTPFECVILVHEDGSGLRDIRNAWPAPRRGYTILSPKEPLNRLHYFYDTPPLSVAPGLEIIEFVEIVKP